MGGVDGDVVEPLHCIDFRFPHQVVAVAVYPTSNVVGGGEGPVGRTIYLRLAHQQRFGAFGQVPSGRVDQQRRGTSGVDFHGITGHSFMLRVGTMYFTVVFSGTLHRHCFARIRCRTNHFARLARGAVDGHAAR